MQSLRLILVLTLLNFTRIILAITLHLRRTLTRNIVLCYIKKIDLNLQLVKRTSKAVNFLNVSETETY